MQRSNVLQLQLDADPVTTFRQLWRRATPSHRDEIRAIIDGDQRSPKELRDHAKKIIEFLNLKTGRNYQAKGAIMDSVMARLRSGATIQQIKAVIAKKSMEWRDDEHMEKYLRPKTLFGRENFENYLGEVGNE